MKKFKWYIDGYDEEGLKGWLMDEDSPNSSIQINVFIDGQLLCNAVADIFRDDLLNAGLGDGNHGFCIPIPVEFFDDMEHDFSFGDALTDSLIAGASKTFLLNKNFQFFIKHPIGVCDFAFLFNKNIIILIGHLTRSHEQLELILTYHKTDFNITQNTLYYFRHDLLKSYPWSSSMVLGFTSVINNEISFNIKDEVYLSFNYNNQQKRSLIKFQELSWNALYKLTEKYKNIGKNILNLLIPLLDLNEKNKLNKFILDSYYSTFITNYSAAKNTLMEDDRIFFAIDYAYSLGETGILIFGWKIIVNSKFKSIFACDENNNVINITDAFFPLIRRDVVDGYRKRFPDISNYCGFACLIPLKTKPSDLRALIIDFAELGEHWIKIPQMNENKKGVTLIKEIFSVIPGLEQNRIFNLFDILGDAIESIAQNNKIDVTNQLIIKQYGIPVENANISIIIPLYGRYDFIRYQLSHFADDSDFQMVDLIYVIDDPNIITASNEYAAIYQPVFNIPFRTVSYDCNLGFAGANNVGVSITTSDTLLLMNSDVLPKQHGWLSILKNNLDILPDAGIVAPLLQFADDSIQHAGMIAQRNNRLPGFLFNIHPHKGQPWYGTDEPYQCTMLTGACLMLKKQDYLDIGGLDEGYILGDFEDSDLCLALRKQNKTLWLVPSAKLWHLERQSQNLNTVTNFRQLLTLYNGWRFQNKIHNDLIANPEIEIV